MLPIFALVFAATPQQAALRAVAVPPVKAVVQRVNIAGPYAAVLTRGGMMEGAPVTVPILVKHFSFGWQPIEFLNFRCRLDTQVHSAAMRRSLMIGMPALQDDRPCTGYTTDTGGAADISAVRRLMHGPLVNSVAVSGDWALGNWYGAGGGQWLFHKTRGIWRSIAGGGGAMGVHEMTEYGVPRSAWCAFAIHDAHCARGH